MDNIRKRFLKFMLYIVAAYGKIENIKKNRILMEFSTLKPKPL